MPNYRHFWKEEKDPILHAYHCSFPDLSPVKLRDTVWNLHVSSVVALPVINCHGLFHSFFDSLSQQVFHEHLFSVRHSEQKNSQSQVAY